MTTPTTMTFRDKLKMQYAMLPIRAINLLLKLLYRFRIEGKENVPSACKPRHDRAPRAAAIEGAIDELPD